VLGATRVTIHVEYDVPGPVVGKVIEPVVHKMNEHETEMILANLKARVEG
jgi:hypothetical protein